MVFQQSPFRGENEDEIYDAILTDELRYPADVPKACFNLIHHLLDRDPDRRLGSGPSDALEIMSHPFFNHIEWGDLYHKRIPAPFVPALQSDTDTKYFDNEFISVVPAFTPVSSGQSFIP